MKFEGDETGGKTSTARNVRALSPGKLGPTRFSVEEPPVYSTPGPDGTVEPLFNPDAVVVHAISAKALARALASSAGEGPSMIEPAGQLTPGHEELPDLRKVVDMRDVLAAKRIQYVNLLRQDTAQSLPVHGPLADDCAAGNPQIVDA